MIKTQWIAVLGAGFAMSAAHAGGLLGISLSGQASAGAAVNPGVNLPGISVSIPLQGSANFAAPSLGSIGFSGTATAAGQSSATGTALPGLPDVQLDGSVQQQFANDAAVSMPNVGSLLGDGVQTVVGLSSAAGAAGASAAMQMSGNAAAAMPALDALTSAVTAPQVLPVAQSQLDSQGQLAGTVGTLSGQASSAAGTQAAGNAPAISAPALPTFGGTGAAAMASQSQFTASGNGGSASGALNGSSQFATQGVSAQGSGSTQSAAAINQ